MPTYTVPTVNKYLYKENKIKCIDILFEIKARVFVAHAIFVKT